MIEIAYPTVIQIRRGSPKNQATRGAPASVTNMIAVLNAMLSQKSVLTC